MPDSLIVMPANHSTVPRAGLGIQFKTARTCGLILGLNRLRIRLISSFLALLFQVQAISPLTIVTQEGQEIEADDFQENDTELILKMSNGERKSVPKSTIKRLMHYRLREKILDEYPILGVTLGTPGILNLNAGYFFSKIGVQVSGSYLGSAYGFQAAFAWKLYDSRSFMHALSGGAGFSSITVDRDLKKETHKWTYGVLSYNLNWYGFFLELGIGVGAGDYSNPQFLGQIGYVYRFNRER